MTTLREIPFLCESENLSSTQHRDFSSRFFSSPPPSSRYCVFGIFSPRNARKVFTARPRRLRQSAFRIESRVPRMIVKGNVKFFRGEIGDASAARVLPMFLARVTPALTYTHVHTHPHTCIHTHTHIHAHRIDGRARWRGARCSAGCSAAAVALRTSAKAHAKTPV